MKYFFKYFRSYLPLMIILVLLIWGQSHVNLTLPDYMSKIVNDGIIKKDISAVWQIGYQMLLITLFGGLCAIGVGFIAAKVSTGFARKLRGAIFERVEQFSLSEFGNFSPASLITRITNDMQQIQTVSAMVMRMAFLAPMMGIGSIIKAHNIAPTMSWIVLVAIGLLTSLIIVLFFIVIPKFTLIQKLVDKLSLETKETLTGVRVIRAYNNDKKQQQKFDKTNQESIRLNIFVNRIMTLMFPLMTLIMGLSSMAVIWIGAYAINDGSLKIGDLIALMQYVMQTIMAFLMISIIFIMIPRAAVSFKRTIEILSTEPIINDKENALALPKQIAGIVEFKNVDFGYKGSEESVLSNISFIAKPGQTTAIIGGTGSGKSTIINLIPRLYDVTSGSITVDGNDIRNLKQSSLRKHIGYVPQKALLFSGTIKSNTLYGSNDSGQLESALEIAQAKDFVDALPQKINGAVSQAGNNFSGGQKQRLSIARALAKKAEIILFDDSFSALDFKTDAMLRKALKSKIKKVTFVIIAQRISTIMHAEQIIVLDKGKIAAIGTHKELLKTSSIYQEIAKSQLSSDELMENS